MRTAVAAQYRCWPLAGFFAGILVALFGWPAGAQTLTAIRTNGPTSNRINVVMLSEGYQASELGTFLQDATNMMNSLMAAPPYQEYSSYFNFFAISVASAESGSDHYTPAVKLVDTYFNSTYDSYGIQRLITIPPNDRDANYSDGQGKVDALLQSLLPEYDVVVLIVNDTTYGGSGGAVLTTSVNSASPEIVVHESGHSFGGLTDEYSDAYPGWVPVEYPNATAQTSRALIKWTSWILGTTPVPTPTASPYTSLVGLFLGAEYQASGWYRPKYDCKMNHLRIPFCEICGEQLVKSVYDTVRSIDTLTPASTDISVTSTQALSFSVLPLQPATHALSVQWFTNGTAVSAATNTTFTLLPGLFSNGTNLVRAEVRDATSLVRDDPANVLSNSATWRMDIELSEMQAASYVSDNGSINFSLNASDGAEPRDNWFANEFTAQALANWITRVDFGVFTTAPNSAAEVVLYRVTDPGGNPALGATRVYTQPFTPSTGNGMSASWQQIQLSTPIAFNVGDKFLAAVFIPNVIAAPPNDKYPFVLDTSGVATGTYWDRSIPNTFDLDDLSLAKPIDQALTPGGWAPGPGHVMIRAYGIDYPGPCTLTIAKVNDHLQISWTSVPGTGGTLWASPALDANADWQPVGQANPFTVTNIGSARFFRVINP